MPPPSSAYPPLSLAAAQAGPSSAAAGSLVALQPGALPSMSAPASTDHPQPDQKAVQPAPATPQNPASAGLLAESQLAQSGTHTALAPTQAPGSAIHAEWAAQQRGSFLAKPATPHETAAPLATQPAPPPGVPLGFSKQHHHLLYDPNHRPSRLESHAADGSLLRPPSHLLRFDLIQQPAIFHPYGYEMLSTRDAIVAALADSSGTAVVPEHASDPARIPHSHGAHPHIHRNRCPPSDAQSVHPDGQSALLQQRHQNAINDQHQPQPRLQPNAPDSSPLGPALALATALGAKAAFLGTSPSTLTGANLLSSPMQTQLAGTAASHPGTALQHAPSTESHAFAAHAPPTSTGLKPGPPQHKPVLANSKFTVKMRGPPNIGIQSITMSSHTDARALSSKAAAAGGPSVSDLPSDSKRLQLVLILGSNPTGGGDVRDSINGRLVFTVHPKTVAQKRSLFLLDPEKNPVWMIAERPGECGSNYDLFGRSTITGCGAAGWRLRGTIDLMPTSESAAPRFLLRCMGASVSLASDDIGHIFRFHDIMTSEPVGALITQAQRIRAQMELGADVFYEQLELRFDAPPNAQIPESGAGAEIPARAISTAGSARAGMEPPWPRRNPASGLDPNRRRSVLPAAGDAADMQRHLAAAAAERRANSQASKMFRIPGDRATYVHRAVTAPQAGIKYRIGTESIYHATPPHAAPLKQPQPTAAGKGGIPHAGRAAA
ncbi:hypothetical protein HK105_200333 [Polyrhizophydium stewartii]|uniref:Uncharacterized protein n=1 Tax=Polyrhizophydium stewartii TaxID=2732419 RepID=A0ABR4NL48_9FUNG